MANLTSSASQTSGYSSISPETVSHRYVAIPVGEFATANDVSVRRSYGSNHKVMRVHVRT
ncbi:hypothetical protein SARC_13461, partial [Sphaeroforma arctica JP610]